MCIYLKKNAILSLFLKNVSPSKRVVCFLNNSHLSMVEGIAFYAIKVNEIAMKSFSKNLSFGVDFQL